MTWIGGVTPPTSCLSQSDTYSVVDLDKGVVDSDDVDTTVVDAVKQLGYDSYHTTWAAGYHLRIAEDL